MITNRPELAPLLRSVWELAQHRSWSRLGPIARVGLVLKRLGWEWVAVDVVKTDEREILDLKSLPIGAFQHAVRNGLRRLQWRQASAKRQDMQGIEKGVDRQATGKFLKDKKQTDLRTGILRSVLAGAVWTQSRLFKARLVDSPQCPYCGT